jgi:putative tryptophan/tyrosine transport system substrate-binding protein
MRESRSYGSVRGAREQSASLPLRYAPALAPTLEDEKSRWLILQGFRMRFLYRRREFITLLGGAAAAWPLAARAQQGERVRRIGVLMHTTADNPDSQVRIAALRAGLSEAGWSVGRNLRIDVSWSGGDGTRLRKAAADLAALGVDVLVAGVGPTTQVLQQVTRSVPIVMAQSVDPVGAGFVASLARPKGNTTGFMQFEYGLSGKWLELLKEMAPRVIRAGVIRDYEVGAGSVVGTAQWAVIQAFASPSRVELTPINFRNPSDAELDMAAFAQEPNGGFIVVVGSNVQIHHKLILALAAKHRIPAVYPYRFYVEAGGLASYGPNLPDLYRRSAGYIDRILRGEKPADLPVQAPDKYELVINLKTAKALGLDVPPMLLARADEVIE